MASHSFNWFLLWHDWMKPWFFAWERFYFFLIPLIAGFPLDVAEHIFSLIKFLNMIQGEGVMMGKGREWGKIDLARSRQTPYTWKAKGTVAAGVVTRK